MIPSRSCAPVQLTQIFFSESERKRKTISFFFHELAARKVSGSIKYYFMVLISIRSKNGKKKLNEKMAILKG
jgi:hypothetical protein